VTVLWRRRAFFRAHLELWSAIGQLLAARRRYWLAALWLGDHRERERPPAATLWTLSAALVALGFTRRASVVSERALTAAEPDAHMRAHLTRVAFRGALEGDTAGAAERLAHVDAGALEAKALGLYRLAEILIAVQRAPPSQRAAMFPDAKQRLMQLPQDADWVDARRRLVKDIGTLAAWAWVHGLPWLLGVGMAPFAFVIDTVSFRGRVYLAIFLLFGVPLSVHFAHAARRVWSRL
jgi:hypothetical protein